jgi:hypothetical protein
MRSGLYKFADENWQLDLRVDIDGARPLQTISGDFRQVHDGSVEYTGSFAASSVTVSGSDPVVARGQVTASYDTGGRNQLQVTLQTLGNTRVADVQFTGPNGPGRTRRCVFTSPVFRRLSVEMDLSPGMKPFDSFWTGDLPSGDTRPARYLTLATAYAEAGIEVAFAGRMDEVYPPDRNHWWKDEELLEKMGRYFQASSPRPDLRAWLFVTWMHEYRHVNGNWEPVLGTMFDLRGRRGCAIFHQLIEESNTPPPGGGWSAGTRRFLLHSYVHEIGHALNLQHCWDAGRAKSLTWMNYPYKWAIATGQSDLEYWRRFGYEFDETELRHLRHGFFKHLAPGGDPYGTGSPGPRAPGAGLRLAMAVPGGAVLGEPVFVALRLLTLEGGRLRPAARLHPRDGAISIHIEDPVGRRRTFRPVVRHLLGPPSVPAEDVVEDAFCISTDANGLLFPQPGPYRIQAVYDDGALRAVSGTATLVVRAPEGEDERLATELLHREDAALMFVVPGAGGTWVAEGEYAMHALRDAKAARGSGYARLLEGLRAARRATRRAPAEPEPATEDEWTPAARTHLAAAVERLAASGPETAIARAAAAAALKGTGTADDGAAERWASALREATWTEEV